MKLSRAAALIIGLVVGCAAGPAVSSLVVPPATAQGATLQRWAYHCVQVWGAEDVTNAANQMGAQGWEMASAATTPNRAIWCFKRPM